MNALPMALPIDPAVGPGRLSRIRARFRLWRHMRPFWAGVWAILGGAVIAYVPATAFRMITFSGNMIWLGVMVGIVIAGFGVLLWVQPHLRAMLGFLIIMLSLASFITSNLGGFLLGMLLAMAGGAMAMAWTPQPVAVDVEPLYGAGAPRGLEVGVA